MDASHHEIASRGAALGAIKRAMETSVGEAEVNLFVSHHLTEIDDAYWQEHLGTPTPEPRQVLDLLELRSCWGDEAKDSMDTFDFTLPGNVTDYVIAVRFTESGEVAQISMES